MKCLNQIKILHPTFFMFDDTATISALHAMRVTNRKHFQTQSTFRKAKFLTLVKRKTLLSGKNCEILSKCLKKMRDHPQSWTYVSEIWQKVLVRELAKSSYFRSASSESDNN